MVARTASRAAFVLAVVILGTSACRRGLAARADGGPPPVVAAAPVGYVEGHVLRGTSPAGGGSMVLIADASEAIALPIYIGGTEATTIDLRLRGDRYVRPLTHDILSETIHELGGRAVQVQVDELVTDTSTARSCSSEATARSRRSTRDRATASRVRKKLLDAEGVPVPAAGATSRRSPTSL